jgi:hypothetical protein
MQEIRHTHISCKTGFWAIDTQDVACITWHPDDDTFTYEGKRYSRAEMTAVLESPEMEAKMEAEFDAADTYNHYSLTGW